MKRLTLLLLIAFLFLPACSSEETPEATEIISSTATTESIDAETDEPTATTKPSPTPTSTPAPPEESSVLPDQYPAEGYGPDNFPEDVNPLTGLIVDDPALLDRRPIAVKIPIFPRFGRPPWGLAKADLVFEYYHNGGISRFHAIFYGQDVEQVAPIRSARFVDEHFITMYKSNFTYGGTYQDVLDYFSALPFANRLFYTVTDVACPPPEGYPVCRFDPDYQNHLMGNTKLLTDYFESTGVDNSRQDLDGMYFNKSVPDSALSGLDLKIRYSSANYHRWEFDPEINEYIRYQEKGMTSDEEYTILVDRITNVPLSADNVVVIIVEHAERESTHEAIDLKLNGTGDAYAFRDGKLYLLKWNRPSEDSVLYLTYPDGEPYPFRPGTTWFELIGILSEVEGVDTGLEIRAYVP